jgi:hypothetical protein
MLMRTRLTRSDQCYFAKITKNGWVDTYHPQIDLSFVTKELGYDILQHTVSGWAMSFGTNTLGTDYFAKLVSSFRQAAAATEHGLEAVIVVGLTNDLLSCVFPGQNTDEYPKSARVLFEAALNWCKKLSLHLKVPVIFCGAGSARHVNVDSVVADVLLDDLSSKSIQNKWATVAQAQAYFYKQFEHYTVRGSWGSGRGSGVYVLQKPAMSSEKCDKFGHPSKTEAYLQGLLIHNVIAWMICKFNWTPRARGYRDLLIAQI